MVKEISDCVKRLISTYQMKKPFRNSERKWMYKLPGAVYANGPVLAKNEKEVRQEIRDHLGTERVPSGTEIWKK
jgi:hypothetical protein